ncbi:hypothetical protein A6R68_22537 [Neotoma lepida]|uniref:Uncharacterized protein n=1 Tax=Neotoma lepida TaxID=56216 RepID=A0A1A6HZ62_NEOLE|nr:hypothetical protein A6R68_22537 [Neotoma lepida]
MRPLPPEINLAKGEFSLLSCCKFSLEISEKATTIGIISVSIITTSISITSITILLIASTTTTITLVEPATEANGWYLPGPALHPAPK